MGGKATTKLLLCRKTKKKKNSKKVYVPMYSPIMSIKTTINPSPVSVLKSCPAGHGIP